MKIGQALAVIGVVTWLGCGHLSAQGRAGAKRFTLSGTVVDIGNQPMAGVEVTLNAGGRELTLDPAISDAQGRFAFPGLTAGEYTLSAEGSGFGTVSYGEMPDPYRVSSIQIGGKNGDKSIVFRIVPRGTIEGTIRDEFGDPMVRASVSLARPVWRGGRTTMAQMGVKSTDDRGHYRFGNLAPGNYTVCVGVGQNSTAPVPGPIDYATRVENRSYSRTCNRAFQLSPGQRTEVDLTPVTTTAVMVRGHVRNLPPQTGYNVNLVPDDQSQGTDQVSSAFVDATQGAFTFRGVAPGRYRLRAQTYPAGGAQKSLAAEIPLDVGSSDIDGVDVALDSQSTVEVAFHGVTDDQMKDVSVMLRGGGLYAPGRGSTLKDAGFQFQPLPPGTYRLSLQTPSETCVASVKLGDREMRGGAFDVAAGAALHIDVAVSHSCGSARMRAIRADAAVPRAKVVLLRSGTAKDPGEVDEDYTDDEGEFTFSDLSPGRYLIWAWAVEGQGAIAGPSSLGDVEPKATVVEVKAGETVKVDVPLLAAAGSGQ